MAFSASPHFHWNAVCTAPPPMRRSTAGRIEEIVTEIAKQIEPRFRDQGWIK
jgi:hypothetical protein